MPVPFADLCVETVRRGGLDVAQVLDVGAQNCVVVARGAGGDPWTVYRFPRYAPERIVEVARRHEAARELGLPAPAVLGVESGPAGVAHLVLRWQPGQPLQDLLPSMTGRARERAAREVAILMQRLRRVPAGSWPFPGSPWAQMWRDLAARAAAAAGCGGGSDDVRTAMAAARVAERAPLGLVHGDLGWGNILFSDSGEVSAVLDWDFAVVGDPCVDVAAFLQHIPEDMVHSFRAGHPDVDADLKRFERYLATWDLQARLWEAQSGGSAPDLMQSLRAGTGR